MFQRRLIVLGYCLLPLMGMSQGWQQFIGGTGDQRAFSVRLAADGSLMVLGSNIDTTGGQSDWYFFQADSLGHVLGAHTWGSPDSSEYGYSIMAVDTQLFLLGNVSYPYVGSGLNQRGAIIWDKIDFQGNVLSQGISSPFISVANSSVPFQNGHLVVGANYLPFFDGFFPNPYWFHLNDSGDVSWSTTHPDTLSSEAVDALVLSPQSAIVLAKAYGGPSFADVVLIKINGNGAATIEKHLTLPMNETPTAMLQAANGSVWVIGEVNEFGNDKDIFLAEIDTVSLDTVWFHRILLPGAQVPHKAIALSNGNIAIVGETIPENSSSRDAFLALTDSLGNLLWIKTYGGLKGDIFWDIQVPADGNGFIIAGQTASFGLTSDLQAWLVRTDSLGQVWSNRALGRVVRDAVQNCVVDANEVPLANWLVTASGTPGAMYTLSDSMGQYSMELDTGTWFISTLPPSGYWNPCEDSVQVFYGQFGDTISIDFPTQVLYECPLLDVDLTTPYLRRCNDNPNFVRYFNYGTSTAPDAVVSIELDPLLSITGSSLPYTQTGNTLYFSVGSVPWLSGGSFDFTTHIDCDSTVLGQVHCMEAHIFPDSICQQFNPEWDGSNLEVSGYCAGDSVVFRVTNTGLGMNGPVSFIITEDQIIFKLSVLQLGQGQDTSFVLYPNGATATMVVVQTPGHPGNGQPMLVIEGCGGGAFSTGYAFQFPQNDGDPSTDIECRANIGSFDPNDKTGLPLGIGDEGIIAPETKIEYLIRFQNTGTDTAFRVKILDTLSTMLDLATFKVGASSHPYRLKISGFGVLSFEFEPIFLPDSTTNWTASQGFVKFSISAKKGILPGTTIQNNAAIYFDQNPAIITNKTRHTIDNPNDFLQSNTTQTPGATLADLARLKVAPNPTIGRICLKLQQPPNSGGLHVEIFDVLGKKQLCGQKWLHPAAQALELDLADLPAGVYFILVKDARGAVIAREPVIKL